MNENVASVHYPRVSRPTHRRLSSSALSKSKNGRTTDLGLCLCRLELLLVNDFERLVRDAVRLDAEVDARKPSLQRIHNISSALTGGECEKEGVLTSPSK